MTPTAKPAAKAPLTITDRVKDLRVRLAAEQKSFADTLATTDKAKRAHDDARAEFIGVQKTIHAATTYVNTTRTAYEAAIEATQVKQRAIDKIAGELASLVGA